MDFYSLLCFLEFPYKFPFFNIKIFVNQGTRKRLVPYNILTLDIFCSKGQQVTWCNKKWGLFFLKAFNICYCYHMICLLSPFILQKIKKIYMTRATHNCLLWNMYRTVFLSFTYFVYQ